MALQKSKKNSYPSKQTINLAMKEKSQFNFWTLTPLLLVIIVAAACFSKFAVSDRLTKMNEKQEEAERIQALNATYIQAVSNYDAVYSEYKKYSVDWMNYNERMMMKRVDIMNIISNEVMPYCSVNSLSIAGSTASMSVTDISLPDIAALVTYLRTIPEIKEVNINSASSKSEDETKSSIAMVITFNNIIQGGA